MQIQAWAPKILQTCDDENRLDLQLQLYAAVRWILNVMANLPEGTKLSLIKGKTSIRRFFFPPVWPIRTRHGPYNSVSGENHLEKGLVWSKAAGKSSQHKKQKQTKKRNQQRPANPPARFAFRQKQNSEATKNGAGPKQKPTNQLEICLGHSDLSHCIITKNMQTN